jgi:hypothetical protein
MALEAHFAQQRAPGRRHLRPRNDSASSQSASQDQRAVHCSEMTIRRPRAAASSSDVATFRAMAEVKSPTGRMTVVAFSMAPSWRATLVRR